MTYIYIFTYCIPSICVIEVENDHNLDTDQILNEYGFNPSDCNTLVSSDKLEIETVNKDN